MPNLYVVATPIGNLSDLSSRAIETLKNVDLILAEDSRKTAILLKHYDIDKPILSYHQQSDDRKKEEVVAKLLSGLTLALVSDAGTPGIADPGNELIDYLYQNVSDLKVIPIPGPSATSTALSICGFDVNKCISLGFLPKKKRKKLFEWLRESKLAFTFFDSPFRLYKTLGELSEYFGGQRRIFVGRELTKMYEETFRGTISQALEHFGAKKVKGEIVVVVEKERKSVPGENRTSI